MNPFLLDNNIYLQLSYKKLEASLEYKIGRIVLFPLIFLIEKYRLFRDKKVIERSGLFDSEWYLKNYDDVKKCGKDPIIHYIQFGWKEGRNPSEDFDSIQYLKKRPDVAAMEMCPLVHFVKFGKNEVNKQEHKEKINLTDKEILLSSGLISEHGKFIYEKIKFMAVKK